MSKEHCPLRSICLTPWKDDLNLDKDCEMRQTDLMKVTRDFIENKILDYRESLRRKVGLDTRIKE